MSKNREPGGIPTGGRWATESKSESDVNLDVTPRASRADILANIDEDSTYHEGADDSTPPGTYALTAKTLGLARTYLMKGEPGDDDSFVLGRTELNSGLTYTGGATLGGRYNGQLKGFLDFHASLVSTGDPATDVDPKDVWTQARELTAKSFTRPIGGSGRRYFDPNPYREGSVQHEAWESGAGSIARDMASPVRDDGTRQGSTNPYED